MHSGSGTLTYEVVQEVPLAAHRVEGLVVRHVHPAIQHVGGEEGRRPPLHLCQLLRAGAEELYGPRGEAGTAAAGLVSSRVRRTVHLRRLLLVLRVLGARPLRGPRGCRRWPSPQEPRCWLPLRAEFTEQRPALVVQGGAGVTLHVEVWQPGCQRVLRGLRRNSPHADAMPLPTET